MAGTKKQIESLEAQVADLTGRLALIEAAVNDPAGIEESAATRAGRRAKARRASKRRAVARLLKPDTKALVVEYLGKHPHSTAGDVAKGLDLNRSTVASSLTALLKLKRIQKAPEGGYEAVS